MTDVTRILSAIEEGDPQAADHATNEAPDAVFQIVEVTKAQSRDT